MFLADEAPKACPGCKCRNWNREPTPKAEPAPKPIARPKAAAVAQTIPGVKVAAEMITEQPAAAEWVPFHVNKCRTCGQNRCRHPQPAEKKK